MKKSSVLIISMCMLTLVTGCQSKDSKESTKEIPIETSMTEKDTSKDEDLSTEHDSISDAVTTVDSTESEYSQAEADETNWKKEYVKGIQNISCWYNSELNLKFVYPYDLSSRRLQDIDDLKEKANAAYDNEILEMYYSQDSYENPIEIFVYKNDSDPNTFVTKKVEDLKKALNNYKQEIEKNGEALFTYDVSEKRNSIELLGEEWIECCLESSTETKVLKTGNVKENNSVSFWYGKIIGDYLIMISSDSEIQDVAFKDDTHGYLDFYNEDDSKSYVNSKMQEKYDVALNLYNEGKYLEAEKKFSLIAEYKDSSDFINLMHEEHPALFWEIGDTVKFGDFIVADGDNYDFKVTKLSDICDSQEISEFTDDFDYNDLDSIKEGKSRWLVLDKDEEKVLLIYEDHLSFYELNVDYRKNKSLELKYPVMIDAYSGMNVDSILNGMYEKIFSDHEKTMMIRNETEEYMSFLSIEEADKYLNVFWNVLDMSGNGFLLRDKDEETGSYLSYSSWDMDRMGHVELPFGAVIRPIIWVQV